MILNLTFCQSILMFFAHPDDETLAAGATIRKLTRAGVKVFVALPGTGVYAREGSQDGAFERLREDCRKAMRVLGVQEDRLILGEFPDNAFDSLPLLRLNKWLEDVVKTAKPEVIFTHHQRCTNIDHRYCHEAAVVATRPSVDGHIALFAGEVPSSTGYLRPTAFEPSLYIGVSEEDVKAKIEAIACYSGEVRPDPHPRSPEVLKALAKVRGSEGGFAYAEAFMAERAFA